MKIVAADIGGTHARFALAEVTGGRVVALDEPVVLPATRHADLASAWRAFGAVVGQPLPRQAAIAVAGPVTGGPVHFVNSAWIVDPAKLREELALDAFVLLNDFGAMAHAAHTLGPESIDHLFGPEAALPSQGAISVIGPGTGLGVAVLQRHGQGLLVLETEGAHVHFAPLNEPERRVSEAVTARYGRTSIERIVSGPGLGEIVRSRNPSDARSDADLWESAITGDDPVTREALGIFIGAYGSAAGDLSLAHGSLGVVLTGGLTNRIRHLLEGGAFHSRFCDKGRYRTRMESIPVKLITHPQPGLFGAAAAYAMEHPE